MSAKKVNNATPPLKKPPVRSDVIEAMEVDDPQPDPKSNVTFFSSDIIDKHPKIFHDFTEQEGSTRKNGRSNF